MGMAWIGPSGTTVATDYWTHTANRRTVNETVFTIAPRPVVNGRCRCWECDVERLIHRFRETWHDLLERKGPRWGWWTEFDRDWHLPYRRWSDVFVRCARTLLRQPVSLAVRRRQKRRRFLQRLR